MAVVVDAAAVVGSSASVEVWTHRQLLLDDPPQAVALNAFDLQ